MADEGMSIGEGGGAADIAFGQLLGKARVDAGLSAAALAAGLFVARESVDRYIRGERRPSEDVVGRWEELCGLAPRTLVGEYRKLPARRGARQDHEREYVSWLVERFSYIHTSGLVAGQHVQLPLADVFVAGEGVREPSAGPAWATRSQEQLALLAERLRCGELRADEYEAQLDRLGVQPGPVPAAEAERVTVVEALHDVDRAVVLGDPGTGKTTLLRYLVLTHARALLRGEAMVSPQLGLARLPVYVNAGEFARSPQRDSGLSAFIAPFLMQRLECPLDRHRLERLLGKALGAGRCLVLVDGLDEVSSAEQRAGVVEQITSFVAAQQPRGNRVACTSRISGYAAAPLPTPFTVLRLLEMDDARIESFLRAYVPAIERSEANDKTAAMVARDAERTVTQLLAALQHSRGVRRLAGSPLLLTALLLVHRTHGRLPERRVDAYNAVVEALGRTWRAYHGVPANDLPDERRLRTWLTRLAEWMHDKRPEGSVTVRDLLEVLGPLWATLQRQPWDPSVLGEADAAGTQAGAAILDFVRQVERHSGLLVERAPRRWGFPHLTFEEFYVARSLAFGRVADRAAQIRRRLHDARYQEPILLALGLIGRDYSEDIEELFDTALLARGDEAERLGLQPTALEDLLGRDFRFALRALADDIPASPHRVDELLNQAIDEALHTAGRGRFRPYRAALLQRIERLRTVGAGTRFAELLGQHLSNEAPTDDVTRERFIELTKHCQPHPAITKHLMNLVATCDNTSLVSSGANVLAGQGPLPIAVSARLAEVAATSDDVLAASLGAHVLAEQGPLPAAVSARLAELVAMPIGSAPVMGGVAHTLAAHVLAEQPQLPASVSARLAELIISTNDVITAASAARTLAAHGPLSAAVNARLAELIRTTPDVHGAGRAAEVLAAQAPLPPAVSARLADLIATADHRTAADAAVNVLSAEGSLPRRLTDRLVELLASSGDRFAVTTAGELLAAHGPLPATNSARLAALMTTTDDAFIAANAAKVLSAQVPLPAAVSARLLEFITTTHDVHTAASAAEALAAQGPLPAAVSDRLAELTTTTDDVFAAAKAARMLARQGPLAAAVRNRLTQLTTTTDDAFAVSWTAQVLAATGPLPDAVNDRLAELILTNDEPFAGRTAAGRAAGTAAEVLAAQGPLPEAVTGHLADLIATGDSSAAHAAAEALAAQGPLPAAVTASLARLVATTDNQYAYRALWRG